MSRPRCSAFLATSLDGFIARADGGLGWLRRFETSGEDYGFREFLASVDALVVGRGTYDAVLGLPEWPYAGKRVVVLTHRPPAPRLDETFASGAPGEVIASLAAAGARRIYVDGGATVSSFLRAGLLDDLVLSVVPVLLGDGIRLFQPPVPERRLALRDARSFPSGLVRLRYDVGTADGGAPPG
jgi:dihydrofolate reductase